MKPVLQSTSKPQGGTISHHYENNTVIVSNWHWEGCREVRPCYRCAHRTQQRGVRQLLKTCRPRIITQCATLLLRELKTGVQGESYRLLLVSAVFIISRGGRTLNWWMCRLNLREPVREYHPDTKEKQGSTYCNVEEPRRHHAKWKKSNRRAHVMIVCEDDIYGVSKPTERGQSGCDSLMVMGPFWEWWRCSGTRQQWLYDAVKLLNVSEMGTWNCWKEEVNVVWIIVYLLQFLLLLFFTFCFFEKDSVFPIPKDFIYLFN